MPWNLQYKRGKIALIADDKEGRGEMLLSNRVREIEALIRDALHRAAEGCGDTRTMQDMFKIYSEINSLFGAASFYVVGIGKAVDDFEQVDAALCAKDAELTADLRNFGS